MLQPFPQLWLPQRSAGRVIAQKGIQLRCSYCCHSLNLLTVASQQEVCEVCQAADVLRQGASQGIFAEV